MPDRYIREKARSSPTLQSLSDAAERAWWRLVTACDDYGGFDADPEILLGELFKRKPKGWTARRMTAVLAEWDRELIHRYTTDGNGLRVYGHILTFPDHQRERHTKRRVPEPPCGNLPQSAAKCGETLLLGEKARQSQSAASCGELPLARVGSPSSGSSPGSTPNGGESEERGGRSAPAWPSPAALVALYNDGSPDESPAVETLSAARKLKAQEYLKAFPEESWWREVFAQMRRSPFLRGLVRREGRKPFVADFDWLLTKGKDQTENVVKVHDGRYRDG